MGAGDLRDLITVSRESKVKNGRGGTVPVVLTIAVNIPAKIVVKRGSEEVQARRLAGTTAYDITVRYDDLTSTITPADTLTDQHGTVYAIRWTGSLDEGRKRWLLIVGETGGIANK